MPYMGDRRAACRILVGKPEGNTPLGIYIYIYIYIYICLAGRIRLECVFDNWNAVAWTGFSWLRIGTGGQRP